MNSVAPDMDNLVLRVTDIYPEARDTVTIKLVRADSLPLQYQAGQFLTLLLSVNGRELRRSYSLSSAPGIDKTPSITIKRVINGEASRYLQDHLRPGDELISLPPAGRFTLAGGGAAGAPLIFIAAGSGMVPVFPLIKTALLNGWDNPVILITQHHDAKSILFRQQLENLLSEYKEQFRWVNFLSNAEEWINDTEGRFNDAVGRFNNAGGRQRKDLPGLSTLQGRLNNWWLEELLGELMMSLSAGDSYADQQDASFYLCGPQAFMRMVQFTLRLLGVADTQIRKENFTVDYVPPPPLLTETAPRKITIHAGNRSYEFEAVWPKTLLQAGLDNHIPMPYSCRGGRCSTCVAKCLKGSVKMSINEVLTEKDLQDGLVLPCVGYAASDLVLSYI
jgi:ring-1,2-phenylacetyl-CoA epoxidase subunit PaaE